MPFYLRSGKALADKASEITVVFQRPPHLMFNLPDAEHFRPNILSICIQPDEGIHLRFEAKEPDSDNQCTRSTWHFTTRIGSKANLPEAYEKLLLEAWSGDASLFARRDEIEICLEAD